ncbi:NAD(P)-dependent oxidoreductase [Aneurinibacillus sp. REN35]|uniref:NAD(P)-dependent oxidoreductase n=1 Tax=Aneurinibacillus sp. REN35 TaxID=3237286 RepID=UPI00352806D5
MRLFIAGASGRVGCELVRLALEEGHEVTAFVRQIKSMEPHARLQIVQGDVLNYRAVLEGMSGADAVLSALGTDGAQTLSKGIPHIIEAMRRHRIARIVAVGTAGILDSRFEPGKFRYESKESKRKSKQAAHEHRRAYEYLRNSGLAWTIVCPTYLPDGIAHGSYRVEREMLPRDGEKITVGDTAAFTYAQLFSSEFYESRIGICY